MFNNSFPYIQHISLYKVCKNSDFHTFVIRKKVFTQRAKLRSVKYSTMLGGRSMNQTQGFWKSRWGKDFTIAIAIFIILAFVYAVVFYLLISSPEGLPFDYVIIFYLPILLIIWGVFFTGLVGATLFPHIVGRLGLVFELNDVSYSDKRSKLHFIFLLMAVSTFLVINYVYFVSLGIYEPIQTLLLAWMVLIFIRAAHYVNPKVGSRIGALVVSFFLPYGLFLGGIYLLDLTGIVESGIEISINIYQVGLFFLYFAIILTAHVPLEILLEYISQSLRKDNQQELNRTDTSNLNGERSMTSLRKYWPAALSFIFFVAAFVFLLYIAITGAFGVSNEIIVVLLTAILSGFGWAIKSEYDKRREIKRREHEVKMEHDRLTFETRRQSYEGASFNLS